MDNNSKRNQFKRSLTRQERNRIYNQPKANTLWEILSEESKKNLMMIKSKAFIKSKE